MSILNRSGNTLVVALAFLIAATGCGGSRDRDDAVALPVPMAELTTLRVTPTSATVPAGAPQQYVATASYTDGTSRDVTALSIWTSASPAAAGVDDKTGLATGTPAGVTIIGAAFGGRSASATLTVTAAVLQSITIAPADRAIAAGLPLQLSVAGVYDDGGTRDLTAVASFSSSAPTIATVASGGLATSLAAGTAVITASAGGQRASTHLTVTAATLVSLALTPPSSALPKGAKRSFMVVGSYTDGTTENLTTMAAYTSAGPAIATVDAVGEVTAVSVGSTSITATFEAATTSTNVTVGAATLTSIGVTPSTASIVSGSARQLTATGTYSDASTASLTTAVAWRSSDTAVVAILSDGIATGQGVGTATVTATLDGQAGTAGVTVIAVPMAGLDLGGATSFAVLSPSSITNNAGGTTLVTGDIGAPSQTVDPVQSVGYTNYKSGATLQSALDDLQFAITDANSRACDVSFMGGIDLGGLIITPGVYCSGGDLNISGILTLDGAGLYIFRTSATFNTAANSQVQVLNGAAASLVFFVPVGVTTLGANGALRGSVLGHSADIVAQDSTTLQGRLLTGGAVILRNNFVSLP